MTCGTGGPPPNFRGFDEGLASVMSRVPPQQLPIVIKSGHSSVPLIREAQAGNEGKGCTVSKYLKVSKDSLNEKRVTIWTVAVSTMSLH